MADPFDLVVIGAGPGGLAAAEEAARLGARVALVERDRPGGTCLNWGCIPTKTMLATAEVIHRAGQGEALGLSDTAPTVDWPALQRRRVAVVDRLVQAHHQQFQREGIEYFQGSAQLDGPGRVAISLAEGEALHLQAKAVILATGSRPGGLPHIPTDGVRVLTSDHALTLEELPKRLAIIGGGVIGCEFASLFGDLGVEVTVIEVETGLLALTPLDADVRADMERSFKKRKIRMHLGTMVEKAEMIPDGVALHLSGGREKTVEADQALVSVGRLLNTEDLGLETVGLARGRRGELAADAHQRTGAEGVYALGDMVGGTQLAHWAMHQGIAATRHALGRNPAELVESQCPAVVFTRPCVAWVGLGEEAARAKGTEVVTGVVRSRALGKAHAVGELDGMVKLVAERGSGRLLGAHLMGHGVEDQVAALTMAVRLGLTLTDIADTIHPHPTMAEGVWEAARAALRA